MWNARRQMYLKQIRECRGVGAVHRMVTVRRCSPSVSQLQSHSLSHPYHSIFGRRWNYTQPSVGGHQEVNNNANGIAHNTEPSVHSHSPPSTHPLESSAPSSTTSSSSASNVPIQHPRPDSFVPSASPFISLFSSVTSFDSAPFVIPSSSTLADLQQLEHHWRRHAGTPANQRRLKSWQLARLIRYHEQLLESLDAASVATLDAKSAATLNCLQLISEACQFPDTTDMPSNANVNAMAGVRVTPFVLFTSSFLHSLLRRCIRICDAEIDLVRVDSGPNSNSNEAPSQVASISEVMAETIETIDQHMNQIDQKNEQELTPHDRLFPFTFFLLTPGWHVNLLSLYVLTHRHAAIADLLASKRIIFHTLTEPSRDYAAYLRELARSPGSWSPSERLRFLGESFHGYQHRSTHSKAIEANITVLILLLTHLSASPQPSESMALGILALLEEAVSLHLTPLNASNSSSSPSASLTPSSLKSNDSILHSETQWLETHGIEFHRHLHPTFLSHALIHGSALTLLACATAQSGRDIEVWTRIRKLLLERRGQPKPWIDLYAHCRLPELLLDVLDSHADRRGMFQLYSALGPTASVEFIRQLVDCILIDNDPFSSHQHSPHSPPHDMDLTELQARLDLSIASSRSKHSPELASLLACMIRVGGALKDWSLVQRSWRELESLQQLRPSLEQVARTNGYVMPSNDSRSVQAVLGQARDVHTAIIDTTLTIQLLDVIGLMALRRGEPNLLDQYFFRSYPTFPLPAIARASNSDHHVGVLFLHAALWRCYLIGDWHRGVEIFQSIPPTRFNSMYDLPSWLEMGMECITQLAQANGRTSLPVLQSHIEQIESHQLISLHFSGGPASMVLQNSRIELTLHRTNMMELGGMLGLMIRMIEQAVQKHGTRMVHIRIAPPARSASLSSTAASTPAIPADEPANSLMRQPFGMSTSNRPLLPSLTPTRPLALPSLPPTISKWLPFTGKSQKSTDTNGATSTPFSMTLLANRSHPSPSSSIHSYLLEEASAAWDSDTSLANSLNEEDSRYRALRRLRQLISEQFRLSLPPLKSHTEPLILSHEDVTVLLEAGVQSPSRRVKSLPVPINTPLRLQRLRTILKEAYAATI